MTQRDLDVELMDRQVLKDKLMELRTAVRWCRDQKGDDRCWKDFELKLYSLMPEGFTPPLRDETIELKNCEQYIKTCYHPGTTYTSPQRRIEELELNVKRLSELATDLQTKCDE